MGRIPLGEFWDFKEEMKAKRRKDKLVHILKFYIGHSGGGIDECFCNSGEWPKKGSEPLSQKMSRSGAPICISLQ